MNISISPENLRLAINDLDTLPSMPVITQKILSLDLNSESGEKAMFRLIEQDPQISAKVIGMSNSPLFGSTKKITSVADAAMVLGLTRVKSITIGIAVMSSLNKGPSGKLNVQELWLNSLTIALAIKTISSFMPRSLRPLDDEIFLAGLLHDIGYLVLNHLDRELSDKLHSRLEVEKERSCVEIENELLGINHCELGSELAKHWSLPESIVAVLQYHHEPDNKLAAIGQPLVSMVSMAEKILHSFGLGVATRNEISQPEWQILGIDSTNIEKLIEQVKVNAEEAKSAAAVFA